MLKFTLSYSTEMASRTIVSGISFLIQIALVETAKCVGDHVVT